MINEVEQSLTAGEGAGRGMGEGGIALDLGDGQVRLQPGGDELEQFGQNVVRLFKFGSGQGTP